jgi:hypothetical protein
MRFKLLALILAASCLPAVVLAPGGTDRAIANAVPNVQHTVVVIDISHTLQSSQTRGIALIGGGDSICLCMTLAVLAPTSSLTPQP